MKRSRKRNGAKNVSGHCKQTERHASSAPSIRQRPFNADANKYAAANTRNGHDRLHIFFHPDYDRRLWHLTRSADPVTGGLRFACKLRSRALAGSRAVFTAPHTAGGELHPALKTY